MLLSNILVIKGVYKPVSIEIIFPKLTARESGLTIILEMLMR